MSCAQFVVSILKFVDNVLSTALLTDPVIKKDVCVVPPAVIVGGVYEGAVATE